MHPIKTNSGGLSTLEVDTLSDNGAGKITISSDTDIDGTLSVDSIADSGSGTVTFNGVDSSTTVVMDNQTTLFPTISSTTNSSATSLQLASAGSIHMVIDSNNTPGADDSFIVYKNALNALGTQLFRLRDVSGANSCSITGDTDISGDLEVTGSLTCDEMIASDNFGKITLNPSTNNIEFHGDNSRKLVFTNTEFRPFSASSGLLDLGSSSAEFRDIYLVNAPTVSSTLQNKLDIQDEVLGLDFILALRPVSFKKNPSEIAPHHGFIAEEIFALVPDFVAIDDFGNPTGLRYTEFLSISIKALQELAAEFEVHKKAFAELEKRVEELEKNKRVKIE